MKNLFEVGLQFLIIFWWGYLVKRSDGDALKNSGKALCDQPSNTVVLL
jgi:hypothetical protein